MFGYILFGVFLLVVVVDVSIIAYSSIKKKKGGKD